MWIPHTIPPVVLRAYTPGDHRTDLETLNRQYEGRVLISEDPEWHVGVFPKKGQVSLALLCLEMIIDGYEYYIRLIKCRNYILQKEFNEKHQISGGDVVSASDDSRHSRVLDTSKTVALKEESTESALEFKKIPYVLDILTDLQRMAVIEELDVEEIAFHIAVETIPDDHYWQRAVATIFPNKFKCDTNWRRTYLRLYTENYIELFNPREDDIIHLIKIVNLVSSEVTTLKIEQILPYCYGAEKEIAAFVPIPEDDELGVGEAAEFDEGFPKADELRDKAFRKQSMAMRKESEVPESEISTLEIPGIQVEDGDSRLSASDILSSVRTRSNSLASGKEREKSEKSEIESQSLLEAEETNFQPLDRSSHLDFNEILPLLICLKEISLVFEVKNVGFEWDAAFFKFTDEDCINLAKALMNSPTIEILEINRSHINGDQFGTLVTEGIIRMPKLKKLNISYNSIADIGTSALCHLMDKGEHKTLETILLGRNRITDEGAKQIAESLKTNEHVLHIDLRLNHIGNEGCQMIAEGLEHNKKLQYISLCGNRLESLSCRSIGKMLHKNNSLTEIDLSCNILEEKGGEHLYEAIQHTKNLRKINLRLTDIGYDLEYNISKCLIQNSENRGLYNDEKWEKDLNLNAVD